MIEISNEELSKVLNLWTGTDEWYEKGTYLYWDDMCQRRSDGSTVLPCDIDKKAHALVNFMLKERKYPAGGRSVFYPQSYTNNHEVYVEWVKDWEKRFGCMSQEELCILPSDSPVEVSKPCVVEDPRTKAERFYAFLATPQPDISPGLWGIVREAEPLTVYSEEVCRQCLGMGKFDGIPCVKVGCKARL